MQNRENEIKTNNKKQSVKILFCEIDNKSCEWNVYENVRLYKKKKVKETFKSRNSVNRSYLLKQEVPKVRSAFYNNSV